MSKASQYLLVSLPASVAPSNHHEDALEALQKAAPKDLGTVYNFSIPEFKIGTLDALVQQADELAKLEGSCQVVVGKVGDSLKNILEGDEQKLSEMRRVDDSESTHMELYAGGS